MEKDYSLLRPFDLEKAKAEEALCGINAEGPIKYVAGPDKDGCVAICNHKDELMVKSPKILRMAPLTWVEGRPVYKGDVLYLRGEKRVVSHVSVVRIFEGDDEDKFLCFSCGRSSWVEGPSSNTFEVPPFTWTPPKVEKEGWVNIYKSGFISQPHPTKEKADSYADNSPVACVNPRVACIRIEWEEPAE